MTQRILVVDDEAHIVQVVSLKLRNAGYVVITAVDGEEGYELACRERPDLIITDYQMPYATGLELCQQLASNADTSHIPVLMLTARGYALDEHDLEIGNIRDVLSKPFSPRQIVDLVRQLLAQIGDDGGVGGDGGDGGMGGDGGEGGDGDDGGDARAGSPSHPLTHSSSHPLTGSTEHRQPTTNNRSEAA